MLGGKPTMEAIEQVLGAPQYNVVTLLAAHGCKRVGGTDAKGYAVYGFQPKPKPKK